MAKPPADVREAVVAALYREFDALQWEQLATKEKSEAYERFLTDPKIGVALDTFMDAGSVRVWIKDGPAKEYVRALEGIPPYARYTERAYPGAETMIEKVLGRGWTLAPDSVEDKPMRCEASSPSGERRFLIWGSFPSLKELVWHSLVHRIREPQAVSILIVTRQSIAPLQPAQRDQAQAMCQIVGAEFKSIVRAPSSKPHELEV
jgi:hypothetical protein